MAFPLRGWNQGFQNLFLLFGKVWSDGFSFEGLKQSLPPKASGITPGLIRWLFLWGVETNEDNCPPSKGGRLIRWLFLWGVETLIFWLNHNKSHLSDQMAFPLRGWNSDSGSGACDVRRRLIRWLFLWGVETRNQNRRVPNPLSLIRWLFLWGVETKDQYQPYVLHGGLIRWLFLWGVETRYSAAIFQTVISSDQMAFPLRGWNIVYAIESPTCTFSLIRWLFLWGVETQQLQTIQSSSNCLIRWLFLWGVETIITTGPILVCATVWSDGFSFEGLKLIPIPPEYNPVLSLIRWLFLWGVETFVSSLSPLW